MTEAQTAEIVDESVDTKDVAVIPETQAVALSGVDRLIEVAIENGSGIDVLEKLMGLKERDAKLLAEAAAEEARKDYVVAMAAFHAETITLVKDKTNTQFGSKYVSKENLINTVAPFLAKHGIAHQFGVDDTDPERIVISCTLTHSGGHSETESMRGEPDTSGKKNPIQQRKSTKTYLEIATFESVTGIASQEGSLSDDGNASSVAETITEEQAMNIESVISEVGANEQGFIEFFKVAKIEDLPAGRYNQAIKMLEKKR